MEDFTEIGEYNPSVKSINAYNAESKIIPTIRSNGILLAHIVPQGGPISKPAVSFNPTHGIGRDAV